jgi:hypothetical protein
MENLHVNENEYITVFMAHHSRNIKILDSIENIAKNLFVEYKVATLTKDEVKFFDEEIETFKEILFKISQNIE